MKRACMLSLVLVLAGCGQMTPSNTTAVGKLSTDVAIEEFEGNVELFGNRLRARRQVKLDAESNYINHGKAVAWYDNGQKAGEMTFQEGLPNGKQVSWHSNGKKRLFGQSQDGLATGRWIEWYDNGQKQSEGDYLEGERSGMWSFWEPTGSLIETVEYRGGRKLGVAQSPRRRTTR